MNTVPRTPLPELSEDRIDRIERGLFADIDAERAVRRRRRRTVWISAGAAAAVATSSTVRFTEALVMMSRFAGVSEEDAPAPPSALVKSSAAPPSVLSAS